MCAVCIDVQVNMRFHMRPSSRLNNNNNNNKENDFTSSVEDSGSSCGSDNSIEFGSHHSESRSFREFKCSEDYLYAMKEDLAEWLNSLYAMDINVDTFMSALETGVTLCR